jgi:hypothetical protein
MVKASSLDAHEHLASFRRGKFLNADLNNLRPASAECTSDPLSGNQAHHQETYHQARR